MLFAGCQDKELAAAEEVKQKLAIELEEERKKSSAQMSKTSTTSLQVSTFTQPPATSATTRASALVDKTVYTFHPAKAFLNVCSKPLFCCCLL